MKGEWSFLDADPYKVDELCKTLGISKTVATVLVNRKIDTVESASLFLQAKLKSLPDPFLLKDADKAAQIVIEHIKNKKKIVIYGDYDVDGITSTLLMFQFLTHLGARVDRYIPHRLEDGYGLNTYTLEEIATNAGDLVITVDCGITSIDEIAYAANLGLKTIIIDHHHVGTEVPPAVAIVNPHREDCEYPFKDMAAVGVVFTFLMVMKKLVERDGFFTGELPNLVEYLDIVAMGTVADLVPLLESNRIFVKHGLTQMRKNQRPGLQALANVCGVKSLKDITPTTISYKMAPRLNAAGRIGNAIKGLELIESTNFTQALQLAEELNLTNEYRQQVEAEIFEQALEKVKSSNILDTKNSIILHSDKWHPGVIGIVASRLVERFYKPTIMISVEDGVGRGSARSIPEVHIYKILEQLSNYLVQFGGHKYAAGLTILEQNIEPFMAEFDKIVAEQLNDGVQSQATEIDASLPLKDLAPDLVVALSKLEPFGMSNSEPNFIARDVRIMKQTIINRAHLHWKLRAKDSPMIFNAIGFGLLNHSDRPKIGDLVDIIYFPKISTYGGNITLQLYVKDFQPSKS
ncbi:single-stranded-DNA-specific exonuclease RecJ [bacterium]|nr:single-stranded-DNA-specific exonuclease RecJ [bacterium]